MTPVRRFKRKNYTDPQKPRHAALDLVRHSDPQAHSIKVVSYNIKHSKKIDRAILLLKEHQDLRDADVICLQEMDLAGVKQIAQAMKQNYIYYPAVLHPRHGKDFGNAVLSKWPIGDDKKIILPYISEKRMQRIAIRTNISVNGKIITVFCLHLKVFMRPTKRSRQIDDLIETIPSSTKQCIIAGDFNTYTKANRRAILNSFLRAGFKLATEDIGWTYKHWYLLNKKNYLDHIYIKGMEVVCKGKVMNRKPSDHIPIWAEVK